MINGKCFAQDAEFLGIASTVERWLNLKGRENTMSTFAEVQANVRRGARFCDIVRPDWASEIDLIDFNFTNSEDCIAGQLFDYRELLRDQGDDFMQNNGFNISASDSGFAFDGRTDPDCDECSGTDCSDEYNMYDVMHEMWLYEIRNRMQF